MANLMPADAPEAEITSLMQLFERVPDPRDPRGRRHPLPAVLSLIVIGFMCGARSLAAIADFGRLTPSLSRMLGFSRVQTPCVATLSNILRQVDVGAVEALLGDAFERASRSSLLHMDGKVLRGSGHGGGTRPAHLISLFSGAESATLRQRAVTDTNEHKAGLEMLAGVSLAGRTITSDAIFTHEDTARAVTGAGGDYIMAVKGNQKELLDKVKDGFEGRPFSPGGR